MRIGKFFAGLTIVILAIGFLLLAAISGMVAYAGWQSHDGDWNPFFPPEMNAARKSKEAFVIGDLGGVPVLIPRHFANYVEYEGDPGFGERRKGPIPKITYASRLNSFGFDVRFPDMAGLSGPDMWQDYSRYDNPYVKGYTTEISPWISVGISSGSRYAGEGYLDRNIGRTLEFDAEKSGFETLSYLNYEKLPKKEHGLTVYVARGVDPKTGRPNRENKDARDLFVLNDEKGKVSMYIRCSNANHSSPKYSSCTQNITLDPQMKLAIEIRYSRYWLPYWREIGEKVAVLILSFKLKNDESITVVLNN